MPRPSVEFRRLSVYGNRFRKKSTAEIVKQIATLGAACRDRALGARDRLLDALSANGRWTRPVAAAGLDRLFARLAAAPLDELVRAEFGAAEAADLLSPGRRARLALAVSPGNIPDVSVQTLVRAWLVKTPIIIKTGRPLAPFLTAFLEETERVAPDLARAASALEFAGGLDEATGPPAALRQALAAADLVIVFGRDETVQEIFTRTPADARFVGYGHRYSVALIQRAAASRERLQETAAVAAREVADYDTRGCLSPQVIFLEAATLASARPFALALAEHLDRLARRMPVGSLDAAEGAAIAAFRCRAAADEKSEVLAGTPGTPWTVVLAALAAGRVPLTGLPRTVTVQPVRDLARALELLTATPEAAGRLQGAACAMSHRRLIALRPGLERLGATWICPLGRLQDPPLTWRQDGKPPLTSLLMPSNPS